MRKTMNTELEDRAPLRYDHSDHHDTDDADSQDHERYADNTNLSQASTQAAQSSCNSPGTFRECVARITMVALFTFFGFGCLIMLTRGTINSNYRLDHMYNQPAHQQGMLSNSTARYSVLVRASKAHNEQVLSSLLALRECQFFDSAFVVWEKKRGAVPKSISKAATVMVFDTSSASHSLAAPNPDPSTAEAVFVMDAQSHVVCGDIDFAFLVWLGSRDRLVGFSPRLVYCEGTDKTTAQEQSGAGNNANGQQVRDGQGYGNGNNCIDSTRAVWMTSTLNMVYTDGMFVHKKYLGQFQSDEAKAVRQVVEQDRACLDLAFNFHVAAETQQGPLWVYPRTWHAYQQSDESLDATRQRTKCVESLVHNLGYFSLRRTHGMFHHVLSTMFSF